MSQMEQSAREHRPTVFGIKYAHHIAYILCLKKQFIFCSISVIYESILRKTGRHVLEKNNKTVHKVPTSLKYVLALPLEI